MDEDTADEKQHGDFAEGRGKAEHALRCHRHFYGGDEEVQRYIPHMSIAPVEFDREERTDHEPRSWNLDVTYQNVTQVCHPRSGVLTKAAMMNPSSHPKLLVTASRVYMRNTTKPRTRGYSMLHTTIIAKLRASGST